jgi:hypothetical protein
MAAILICGPLNGPAGAVTASGSPIRVDVDPRTAWYGFFGYQVTATQTGGFGVAWEEDRKEDQPFYPVIEGIRVRVFNSNMTPVGPPFAPDMSGHTLPTLNSLQRLSTSKLILVCGMKESTTTRRKFFEQAIAIVTQAKTARQLLNSTTNTGTVIGRTSGLADGRAVFGWFDGSATANTPTGVRGRFINTAGTPLTANLSLGSSPGFALSDIRSLDGGSFAVLYRRFDGSTTQVRARVFKADGVALGQAHDLAPGASNLPMMLGFPDGRILVATWISTGTEVNLIGQIYNKTWAPVGAAGTLIADGATNDRVDLTPLADGGVLLVRTYGAYPSYHHQVRRFGKTLRQTGTPYTFTSLGLDFARIAALSATKGVIVFKQNVGGRARLMAQALNL